MKAGILGVLGLGGGVAGTYTTAVVNTVIKPTKPVANFSVTADGLGVTCQNQRHRRVRLVGLRRRHSLEPFAAESAP